MKPDRKFLETQIKGWEKIAGNEIAARMAEVYRLALKALDAEEQALSQPKDVKREWYLTREEIERWREEEEVMPYGTKDTISRMALDALEQPTAQGWRLSIEGYAGLTNVLKDLNRSPVQCVGEASLEALVKAHAEAQPIQPPRSEVG